MDGTITSSEKAYRKLLEAILENRLERGEFLSQRRLAALTDTSIISVREALKRLEHEYLIEVIPKWGVRIPVETRERIIELYTIREALEVMAAYILAQHIEREDAALLQESAEACDLISTEENGKVELFAEMHRKFHLQLAEATKNRLLKQELERLRVRSLIFQSSKAEWYRDLENPEWWHRDLVGEILSGDPDHAEEAMHRHVQHGLHHDLRLFGEEKESE
jgi:DNA-binding GntR family transcriptional regulator